MKNDKKGQAVHLSPLLFSASLTLWLAHPSPRFLAGKPHPHSSGFSLLITSAVSEWFCLMDWVALTTDVFAAVINSFSRGSVLPGNSATLVCILQYVYKARRGTDCDGKVSPHGPQIFDLHPAETRLDFCGNLEALGMWQLNIWRLSSHLKPCPGYSLSLHWGANMPAAECQCLVENSLFPRIKVDATPQNWPNSAWFLDLFIPNMQISLVRGRRSNSWSLVLFISFVAVFLIQGEVLGN